MALVDESNYAYVKQVALDWRELVREKRKSNLFSPTISMQAVESQQPIGDTRSRTQSMIPAERRESSFYRHRFSQQAKPVEIERQEVGSMEPDRIRVSGDVLLYIYQPIFVSNARMASIQFWSPSDISITSSKLKQPIREEQPTAKVESDPSPEPKSP
ncbi:uncharacterized protein LOC6734427 [Drosophila simulans]|uniref:GD25704 n=1 Tax=Drosophila simulans TaxID=7240 RepID=B4QFC2_DROSI|nr:uncharacterized protein LOC6734427 [Drosophila simulans]EDX07032.1 GD25704 [Drosophila simulans]KMY96672.1 uncharacterized protein Dsimw501_GD25704 [Drosophila simulans]